MLFPQKSPPALQSTSVNLSIIATNSIFSDNHLNGERYKASSNTSSTLFLKKRDTCSIYQNFSDYDANHCIFLFKVPVTFCTPFLLSCILFYDQFGNIYLIEEDGGGKHLLLHRCASFVAKNRSKFPLVLFFPTGLVGQVSPHSGAHNGTKDKNASTRGNACPGRGKRPSGAQISCIILEPTPSGNTRFMAS